MAAAGVSAPELSGCRLLTEVPGPHSVQFYETDEFLAEAVATFLGASLSRDDACLAIVAREHRDAIVSALAARGVDERRAEREGRFVVLDVDEALARLTVDDRLDATVLRTTIAPIVRELARRGRSVRVYGEMVDRLCGRGSPEIALVLEEAWNELARELSFALLCGYSIRSFGSETDRAPFERLCAIHSHVIPAEGFSRAGNEDARLREVCMLQQRAHALEAALRQRDEFLSLASHELRTPLAVLQLQAQLLQQAAAQDGVHADRADRAARIVRSSRRVAAMIDQLFDVTGMTHGRVSLNCAPMDLAALVREVVDTLDEKLVQSGCDVRVVADGPVEGVWDKARLGQVVMNLLGNAMKFGPRQPIDISVTGTRELAILSVRDHGSGVAPRDHARIFERFERASSSARFPGLGLGLWIARKIVHTHGGTIALESEVGQGARFTVSLPRESAGTAAG